MLRYRIVLDGSPLDDAHPACASTSLDAAVDAALEVAHATDCRFQSAAARSRVVSCHIEGVAEAQESDFEVRIDLSPSTADWSGARYHLSTSAYDCSGARP